MPQVRERVDRICRVLVEDLGLVPGNRVLLRGGNSIGLALAWLAVVKAGLIAVATMPLLRARELGDIIDKAQPTVALCDAEAAGGAGTGPQRAAGARHGDRFQCAGRARIRWKCARRRRTAPSRLARRPPTTSP